MNNDPILATIELPGLDRFGRDRMFKHHVYGGLHYPKGNPKPYFSITTQNGCNHNWIEKHFPNQFTDLIQMHLSDMDGVPMHAEENGWYWFSATDNLKCGERFHGEGTPEMCFQIWRQHLRLTDVGARNLQQQIFAKWNWPDMREAHKRIVEDQRPRWKLEADACIVKHKLVVYGDTWRAPDVTAA